MILYIDIETEPNPDMVEHVQGPVATLPSEAPGNYKKAEAINDWIVREDKKRAAEYQSRLGKMTLDIDFARITEIAYALESNPVQVAQVSEEKTESQVLQEFWEAMAPMDQRLKTRSLHPRCICGFNVLGYDIPIILRRSFMLGVSPSCVINMRRYSTSDVIDLMQLFYHWGQAPGPRYRGLKAICRMHGIKNVLPDLDGSRMAEMDAETRRKYVSNDVEMTRVLAQRMAGYYYR